ncbi:MAG: hypothetical protein K1X89_14795 [Myxococcaceae bacterium]|nr:hypothetical protein [Myxococcaceae bacterium]
MRPLSALGCAVLLVGCSTVERTGPRLRVEPFERRCVVTEVEGALRAEGTQALRLKVSGQSVCSEGEVDVMTTERYSTSWVPAGSVGTAAGAIVATPFVIAGVVLLQHASGSTTTGRGAGELLGLAALPGAAAGYIVARAIGQSEVRVADGPPQRVERVTTTQEVAEPLAGPLKTDGAGAGWTLENGTVLLPRAELMSVDLRRLLFQGVLVKLDSEGERLAESLAVCRGVLKAKAAPGTPGCAEVRQLAADAKRCEAGGWSLPAEVQQWQALRLSACP